MRKTIVEEGVVWSGGYTIAENATQIKDDPIPIVDVESKLLGRAENLRREGLCITGDFVFWEPILIEYGDLDDYAISWRLSNVIFDVNKPILLAGRLRGIRLIPKVQTQ